MTPKHIGAEDGGHRHKDQDEPCRFGNLREGTSTKSLPADSPK